MNKDRIYLFFRLIYVKFDLEKQEYFFCMCVINNELVLNCYAITGFQIPE